MLPKSGKKAQWSNTGLLRLRGFAIGVTGISLTSIVVSQADRLILSRLLPLDQFGYYTFAANAAAMISRVVIPINGAVSPRLTQLVAIGDKDRVRKFYNASTQLVALLVIPLTAIICALAPQLLDIWMRDHMLTQKVVTVFRILLVGYSLQTLLYLPFTLQLANGWTSLSLIANSSWIVVMIPGIFLCYHYFGTPGVASLWLILNLLQVVVTVRVMHSKLLPDVMGTWYKWSVVIPIVISVVAAGLSLVARNSTVLVLAGSFVLTFVAAAAILFIAPDLRSQTRRILQRSLTWLFGKG
jgi:O-antigen/teichoic acid export membrane protein